jgi:hypothetical protein
MEWTIKLKARSGWEDVEAIEAGGLKRRVAGLTADEIILTGAKGKDVLSEPQRLVCQTQLEEYTTCARVCPEWLTPRRQGNGHTRTVQTLFGTVEAGAPRISVCPYANEMGFVDLSFSPLTRLCMDPVGYAGNNRDTIVNYHRRYHAKQPVSAARAEGCADETANARMGKEQRMRWSPHGAHRVALVRAAVLDGRLKPSKAIAMAA